MTGELVSADSIRRTDTARYYTSANRTVYGGGGIVPDIFVPLDTNAITKYYNQLVEQDIFNDFITRYLDLHRNELLAKYKEAEFFCREFNPGQDFINDFFSLAEKRKINKDEEAWRKSGLLITTQLKASLARNLYHSQSAYYQIMNNINDIYNKTLECLRNDTFEKMKIEK